MNGQKQKYPYIVRHLMAAIYDRSTVLKGLTKEECLAEARVITEKYKIGTCVIWSKNECSYIEPGGKITESNNPPSGGVFGI